MQLSVLTGGGSVWREWTTGGGLTCLFHLPQHSQATIIFLPTFAHSLSYWLPSGPHASLFPTLSTYIARAASLPRSHFLFLVSSSPSHPPPDPFSCCSLLLCSETPTAKPQSSAIVTNFFSATASLFSNDILLQTLIYSKTTEQDRSGRATQDPLPPSPPLHPAPGLLRKSRCSMEHNWKSSLPP